MVNDPRTLRTHPELRSHASFPLFKTVGEKPKSRLEKLLSVFADVRSGEGLGALLMAANAFILLSAYYLLKPAREALILAEGGAEVKAYASAGQALLLLLVVPIYGWIGSRVNRFVLVAGSLVFFALNLAAFFILDRLARARASSSIFGSASLASSSSPSSGPSPTTSTPKARAAVCSPSSASAVHSAHGGAPPPPRKW